MSANGTERRFAATRSFGRYWSRADIGSPRRWVGSGANDPQQSSASTSYCSAESLFQRLPKFSFEPLQCCHLSRERDMRRRKFLGVLGGAAATWPFPARAQQGERVRRIGVIMNLPPDDPEAQLCITTFQQELKELGWSVGRNAQIDFRWGPSSIQQYFKQAEELVALAPDVILGAGGPVGLAVQRANPNVPVVLAQSIDPVGTGVVASLARPGGNITGFTQFEYSLSGKWLGTCRLGHWPVGGHTGGSRAHRDGISSNRHSKRFGNRAQHHRI